MKKPIAGILLVLLTATFVSAQRPAPLRIMTHPNRPQREPLRRLGLTLAWHMQVKTGKARDGIFHIEVLPHKNHPQLLVQLHEGTVMLIDGESGDLLWRNRPGQPYWDLQPPSANEHSVFTTARDRLYVLNRNNGKQRYYSVDGMTGQKSYGLPIPSMPGAGSSADKEALYFVLGDRAVAFNVPAYNLADELAAKEVIANEFQETRTRIDTTPPTIRWATRFAEVNFQYPPVVTKNRVGLASTDGTFLSVNKHEPKQVLDFKAYGHIVARPGQYRNMVYLGSQDYAVYAVNAETASLKWRFLSGGPILRQPHANDHDVYVVAERRGMSRLDRLTGREIWRSPPSAQFLAANERFVYTRNRNGTLMVLDHKRGTLLASYDVNDWKISVPNDLTDRIYLANHDGQIMCLHYHDNPTPVQMSTPPPQPKDPKDEKKEKKKLVIPPFVGFNRTPSRCDELLDTDMMRDTLPFLTAYRDSLPARRIPTLTDAAPAKTPRP